jgi:hypothetical protein
MDKSSKLISRISEFSNNVWNHSEDEFQASFDERRNLTEKEFEILETITKSFAGTGMSESDLLKYMEKRLTDEKKLIETLLLISGLTRNKILQDIKASVGTDRNGLSLSSHLNLASNPNNWKFAGPYLIKKLRKVLGQKNPENPERRIFEALNQATWPGYIRQERAKRSGHEAEYRIATLLSNCRIPFAPEEKADNPLCRDATWKGVSFDIVIPNADDPLVCVKSTVHTANIGQYGESKDHLEIDEARRLIDSLNAKLRPTLVGFIDGVGFESNKAGLEGVLMKSDEFCQFKTIWKLVIIACSRLGRNCEIAISKATAETHIEFLSRYSNSIKIVPADQITGGTPAGEAIVSVSS